MNAKDKEKGRIITMNEKKSINHMSMTFTAKSANEGLARAVVSAFAAQLDPTIDELSDLKTAVSEAVTNSIIHGYGGFSGSREACVIKMDCTLYENAVELCITDYGKGIENVDKAMEPMYTSAPELERSGMGFTIMQSFMDSLEVVSEVGVGTKVTMYKVFGSISQG